MGRPRPARPGDARGRRRLRRRGHGDGLLPGRRGAPRPQRERGRDDVHDRRPQPRGRHRDPLRRAGPHHRDDVGREREQGDGDRPPRREAALRLRRPQPAEGGRDRLRPPRRRADGTIAEYGYDLVGNKTSETNLAGLTTRFELRRPLPREGEGPARDEPARPGSRTARSTATTSSATCRSQTDANGRATAWEYDGLNRLIQTTNALGQVTTGPTSTSTTRRRPALARQQVGGARRRPRPPDHLPLRRPEPRDRARSCTSRAKAAGERRTRRPRPTTIGATPSPSPTRAARDGRPASTASTGRSSRRSTRAASRSSPARATTASATASRSPTRTATPRASATTGSAGSSRRPTRPSRRPSPPTTARG